jgi:hypothetical protein
MSRHFVAVAVLFVSLSLHAEVPLGASDVGPVYGWVWGAVAHGDGFFVFSDRAGGGSYHLLGTRISATGEIVDPRGVVLASNFETYAYQNLRWEEGQLQFISAWPRPESGYNVKRRIIDPDANRVLETKATAGAPYPSAPPPKNARGETLAITYNNGPPLVSFVDSSGVARKPTQLPEAYGVRSFVPWGDDEWLILASASGGYVWYRISEAKRDTPQKLLVSVPQSFVYIENGGGEFALLYEVTPQDNPNDRVLTLRVIRPNGSTTTQALLRTDVRVRQQGASYEAALARDGQAWLVACTLPLLSRELRVWRVADSAIEMLHTPGGSYAYPTLVSGTTQNLLIHQTATQANVYVWPRGTTIAPNAAPQVLTVGVPSQTMPHAVATPTGVFTVWREKLTGMMRVLGVTEPVLLSAPGVDVREPRVARNGDTYAVAWIEGSATLRVRLRRFDAQGNPLDTQPLLLDQIVTFLSTLRVAIAPEGGGFRVAWHNLPLANVPSPQPTIYTTHVDARRDDFDDPEALTPLNVAASDPVILTKGNDTVLLFRQMSFAEPAGIFMRHYTNGVAPRGPNRRLTDGDTFDAAVGNGEILIATSHATSKTEHCTDAQRFSFDGAMLAPAVSLGCAGTYEFSVPPPSVIADGDRWWVAPASKNKTHLYEVNGDGTLGDSIRFFPRDTFVSSVSFFPTENGPAAVYSRSDPSAEMTERAFLRTFPWPRKRAVRH